MTANDLRPIELEQFYSLYIKVLAEGTDLITTLEKEKEGFYNFIAEIPEEKLSYAYAEGKWTVAQVLMHLTDAERIFQYRAFRFSRNDDTALPGFDQELYINESAAIAKDKNSLLQEYKGVRSATLSLFNGLDETLLKRTGTASDIPWSVGGLGLVICGHQQHHKEILIQKYL